jgi:hypothetical protein
MLISVLLLHWPAFRESHPDHVVIHKMLSVYEVNEETVVKWHESMRRRFVKDNGAVLVRADLDDSDTIGVSTITEAITNQARYHQAVHEVQQQSRDHYQASQEQTNRLVQALIGEVQQLGRQVHALRDNAVTLGNTVTQGSAITPGNAVSPVTLGNGFTQGSNFTQGNHISGVSPSTLSQDGQSSAALLLGSPAAVPRGEVLYFNSPALPRSQREGEMSAAITRATNDLVRDVDHLRLESLFIRWYSEELHKREVKLGSKDRKQLNMLARLMFYLKLFLPDGTVITPRPSNAGTLQVWITSLSNLGRTVEEKVHAFFSDRQAQDPNRKRKRAIQTLAQATYKRFIGTANGELPTPSLVLDQATHTVYNYNTFLDLINK